jgi:hypothetical protein
MYKVVFILLLLPLLMIESKAEEGGPELSAGADLMSRYVWRGTDFGRSPSIQPNIAFSWDFFKIGSWGAFTTNGTNAQECDLYMSFSLFDGMFSVGATDYFFPNDEDSRMSYYEFDEEKTGHIVEANVAFNGTETIPVGVSFNYNFYGFDDANSMYLEFTYSSKIKENTFDLFMGFALDDGLYGETFGVVNFGVTAHKDVKITDSFSLPVQAKFITNPQAENIHLVFGISL